MAEKRANLGSLYFQSGGSFVWKPDSWRLSWALTPTTPHYKRVVRDPSLAGYLCHLYAYCLHSPGTTWYNNAIQTLGMSSQDRPHTSPDTKINRQLDDQYRNPNMKNGIRDACSTADCCPLLSIDVNCCQLLSIVVNRCPLLSIVVHCCPLLSIVVHWYHRLPLDGAVIGTCWILPRMFWLNDSCVLVKLIIADISQCFPFNLQQFPNVLQRYSLKAQFLMLQLWICSHNA